MDMAMMSQRSLPWRVARIDRIDGVHPNTKQKNENNLNIKQFIPASKVRH